MTAPVGRVLSVVFDCPDPDALGRFWEAVLGYSRPRGGADWVATADPEDRARRLSFQRVDDYTPPTWPARDRPQQAHIDISSRTSMMPMRGSPPSERAD